MSSVYRQVSIAIMFKIAEVGAADPNAILFWKEKWHSDEHGNRILYLDAGLDQSRILLGSLPMDAYATLSEVHLTLYRSSKQAQWETSYAKAQFAGYIEPWRDVCQILAARLQPRRTWLHLFCPLSRASLRQIESIVDELRTLPPPRGVSIDMSGNIDYVLQFGIKHPLDELEASVEAVGQAVVRHEHTIDAPTLPIMELPPELRRMVLEKTGIVDKQHHGLHGGRGLYPGHESRSMKCCGKCRPPFPDAKNARGQQRNCSCSRYYRYSSSCVCVRSVGNLFRINKQLRAEALDIFYRNNTFEVSGFAGWTYSDKFEKPPSRHEMILNQLLEIKQIHCKKIKALNLVVFGEAIDVDDMHIRSIFRVLSARFDARKLDLQTFVEGYHPGNEAFFPDELMDYQDCDQLQRQSVITIGKTIRELHRLSMYKDRRAKRRSPHMEWPKSVKLFSNEDERPEYPAELLLEIGRS